MLNIRRALKKLRHVAIGEASWLRLIWVYFVATGRFWLWRVSIWLRSSYYRGSIQLHMKQTLLIIRHGQTTWNIEHRLPGQLPGVGLTEEGRQQATRLARALTVFPLSTVVSSPLERARDTAQYLIDGRNLELHLDPDLMDTNVGYWSGQVFDGLMQTDPAWKAFVQDPTVAPDGVETFPQVQQRVVTAVERWRMHENAGSYIAFVAHADVVKLLLAHYMHLDVRRAVSLHIDNASVSIVEIVKEERPRVVAVGWCPQPGWLTPPIPPEEVKTDQAQETSEQTT